MSDSTVVMASERVAGAQARAAACRFSLGGGGNLAIARRIPKERQDAAWKFIEWMTSAENAAQWSMASGYVATRKSTYEVPAMILKKQLDDAVDGKVTPKEAMTLVQKQVEAVIKR